MAYEAGGYIIYLVLAALGVLKLLILLAIFIFAFFKIRGHLSKKQLVGWQRLAILSIFGFLVIFLIAAEFIPPLIDSILMFFPPDACQIHWLFPFHFFYPEMMNQCVYFSAALHKDLSYCNSYDCMQKVAEKYGARDCSGLEGKNTDTLGACLAIVANITGNSSICENEALEQNDYGKSQCLLQAGMLNKDVSVCEDESFGQGKLDCLIQIINASPSADHNCPSLSNQDYALFCSDAENAMRSDLCRNFPIAYTGSQLSVVSCIAIYRNDTSFCGILPEGTEFGGTSMYGGYQGQCVFNKHLFYANASICQNEPSELSHILCYMDFHGSRMSLGLDDSTELICGPLSEEEKQLCKDAHSLQLSYCSDIHPPDCNVNCTIYPQYRSYSSCQHSICGHSPSRLVSLTYNCTE